MSKNSDQPSGLLRLSQFAVAVALASILAASPALAHCDTLDGPVVMTARHALEIEDPTPVFKWVMPEHEAEIRDAFNRTLVVRRQSADAQELADRWFFETLVRIHREGEGAPFTGLQAAGSPIEPVILAADRALASGSGDELSGHLSQAVAKGVERRFAEAREAKKHADESVEAGRRYVAAYVELTHYVEALDALAAGHGSAHGSEHASGHGGE